MKKLKTYNESFLFNRFDNIYKKVTKDLGINLYFSATFGTAISSFFTFFFCNS